MSQCFPSSGNQRHFSQTPNIGAFGDIYSKDYASLDFFTVAYAPGLNIAPLSAGHADATIVLSNQQQNSRPFHEDVHGPTYTQASQYLDNPSTLSSANSWNGQQSEVPSFDTCLNEDLIGAPVEVFGRGSFPISSTWTPQPIAQDLFSFDIQDQSVMFGVGEAQMPASSGFVTTPAPAPAPIPQTNVGPRHHCPLGCAKSFRRPGDYRRHMKKHDAPRYKCVVIDCDKTFYRADKLRAHIKQGHKLTL